MKRFILLVILALGVSFSNMSYSSTVLNDAENEIVIEQHNEVSLEVFTFDNPTVAKMHVDPGDVYNYTNHADADSHRYAIKVNEATYSAETILVYRNLYSATTYPKAVLVDEPRFRRARDGLLCKGLHA